MKKILVVLLVVNFCFAQTSKRKLVWEENFKGSVLNEKNWNFELGNGCPNCGWGNNERQLYTKDNHEIVTNNLIITARKEGDKYTSTRITTKGKKRISIRSF